MSLFNDLGTPLISVQLIELECPLSASRVCHEGFNLLLEPYSSYEPVPVNASCLKGSDFVNSIHRLFLDLDVCTCIYDVLRAGFVQAGSLNVLMLHVVEDVDVFLGANPVV